MSLTINYMSTANILGEKSFEFAIRIVNLYKFLTKEQNEQVLSKQILRSGTSIGAMISESEHSESKMDFIHKLAIAQKEANETIYWLKLLHATNYLEAKAYKSILDDATDLIKILTASIKTAKRKIRTE